jgi:hypothetical protein
VYTLGKDNGRADALSRREDIASTKQIIKTAILKVNNNRLLRPAYKVNALLRIGNDVPEESQDAIIRQHHNNPVHSYPSITRTIELIQRNYEFLEIKAKVTAFIAKCADC